jgi:hypothetical protein
MQPWDIAGSFEEGAQGEQKRQQTNVDMAGQAAFGRTLQLLSSQVQGAQQPQGGMPQGMQPPSPGGLGGLQGLGGQQQPPMMPPQGQPGMPPGGQMPGGVPPQMQRPPMPGGQQPQPQQPMGGVPGGGGMPQGGQMMPQGMPGQPPGGVQRPSLNWQVVMQKVQQANPGAPPQVLAAAVDRFLPLMNAESQQQWRQVSEQLRAQQLEQGEQRVEQGQDRVEQGRQNLSEREREFDTREARLSASQAVRQDQAWQRLDQQKQALQVRIAETKDKTALSQWRAIVDAQHKRAMEIIQANSGLSGLSGDDKKKLLDDENQKYEDEISQMKQTVSGGQGQPQRPASFNDRLSPGGSGQQQPAATGAGPVKVKTPEEAQKLGKGTHYITPDGKEYVR